MDVFAQPQGPLKFFGAKDISVDLCIEPERSYVFKFVSYTNIKKTCLTNNWDDKLDVLFWETHQVYETEWIQRMIIPHDMGFPTFSFFVCHDRGLRRMFIHVYKDSLVANRKKNCILFWKKKMFYENTVRYTYIYIIYIHIWYIYIYVYCFYLYFFCVHSLLKSVQFHQLQDFHNPAGLHTMHGTWGVFFQHQRSKYSARFAIVDHRYMRCLSVDG